MKTALLVLLAVSLATVGDVAFKKAESFPWVGFFFYAISGLPIWYAYRNGSWMQIGILWQSIAIIIAIVLGITMFHEPLTIRKCVGFIFALAAAILAN